MIDGEVVGYALVANIDGFELLARDCPLLGEGDDSGGIDFGFFTGFLFLVTFLSLLRVTFLRIFLFFLDFFFFFFFFYFFFLFIVVASFFSLSAKTSAPVKMKSDLCFCISKKEWKS